MTMQKPANVVNIGENAYLFPSQAAGQVTDCFVLAHGGTPSGQGLTDYYFTVPAGCTVKFFADGGNTNMLPGNGDPINGFRVMCGTPNKASVLQQRIKASSTKTGNQKCRDYILAKGVGDHFGTAPNQNHYMEIANELTDMANHPHATLQWLPHYVSVRNRSAWGVSTNVWLSRLISDIQAWDPTVVNFFCANCRSYLNGKKARKYIGSAGGQIGADNDTNG